MIPNRRQGATKMSANNTAAGSIKRLLLGCLWWWNVLFVLQPFIMGQSAVVLASSAPASSSRASESGSSWFGNFFGSSSHPLLDEPPQSRDADILQQEVEELKQNQQNYERGSYVYLFT